MYVITCNSNTVAVYLITVRITLTSSNVIVCQQDDTVASGPPPSYGTERALPTYEEATGKKHTTCFLS